jgi:lipopolysaccharide transport system ATP-binding protein
MSDIVIQAEGLGKKYLIDHQTERERYTALRDVLARNVRDYWRKAKALVHGEPIVQGDEQEEIWALKEVNFEIRRGDTVGIIGRNGAGKSTLLKVLSRITEPSAGRVTIKGRVASLLEVGTGFHPELTGRENIYLNGAILGMTRTEIRRKFDEIVAFAEVEKFLDTPVKRYSSGMYVRLAFAVAAHLEPEILMVDEVLAVGDAGFQKKCLGKMGDVVTEGRTVLFVSHNMAAIQQLCSKVFLLDNGRVDDVDHPEIVISRYFQKGCNAESLAVTNLVSHRGRRSGFSSILKELRILADGDESTIIRMGGSMTLSIFFASPEYITNIRFGIVIEDRVGQRLLNFSPSHQAPFLVSQPVQKGIFLCNIPCVRLLPGGYFITLIIGSGSGDLDRIEQAAQVIVEPADVFHTGFAPEAAHGVFYQESEWKFTDLMATN